MVLGLNTKGLPMTRELEIAVERAARAAQSDPLVEALEALRELVKCVRNEDEYGGCTMDDALIDADEILAKYAPDREGGAK